MELTFYKIENKAIVQVDEPIKPADWPKKIDWIDIRTDDRREVADYFRKLNLFSDLLDWINNPQEYPFTNTFEGIITLNLPISNSVEIYKTDYTSFIIQNKLVISILPKVTDLFNEHNLSMYSDREYPSLANFLFNILALKFLAQNNANISFARNRLQSIEKLLTTDPEEITSIDIMACERDISQLSDIIEDQYVGFEILLSLSATNLKQGDFQQISNTIKGFEPLNKAMIRLEKKAESLRLQYMLFQQEKSTKKINVLTIIQAIFVPLTFIAGVYGMNFVNIPELNWPSGYLLVWLVFIGLAGGLLSYFYRKGWFD